MTKAVPEPLTQVSNKGIGHHYQQTLLYLQSPMTLGVLARPDEIKYTSTFEKYYNPVFILLVLKV